MSDLPPAVAVTVKQIRRVLARRDGDAVDDELDARRDAQQRWRSESTAERMNALAIVIILAASAHARERRREW